MIFSWYIVVYLFLAGAGAGAFFIASCCCVVDAVSLTPRTARLVAAVQPAFYITPICMVLAVLLLFADLGFSDRVLLLLNNPYQSIMSVGAWMVALLTGLSLLFAGLSATSRISQGVQWFFMISGAVLAFGTMTYTGLLLSALPSVDFWNTGWLTALFVASALSCGCAAIVLADGALHGSPSGTSRGPWRISAACLITEATVLFLFIASRQIAGGLSLESTQLLLLGELAPTFWLVPVGIGLVIPAVLHLHAGRRLSVRASRLLSSLATLVGGFGLRYCIVAAAIVAEPTLTVMQII